MATDSRARKVSIPPKITVHETGHPTKADDPLASQRAELIGKLAAAQFSLEAVMAELERSGVAPDAVRNQLQSLTDIQRMVGTATPADLAALRAAIASTIETAQGVAQQARTTAATENGARDLAGTTTRTRATITGLANDLFERRVLDPYLQFASAEDEAEYRRREAERHAYINSELAKGTPQGAANAADATVDQIEDAGAHGADRSPEYDDLRSRAIAARDEQHRSLALAEAGPSRVTSPSLPQQGTEAADLDEIAAVFRFAGVLPPPDSAKGSGHGLTDQAMQRSEAATRYT